MSKSLPDRLHMRRKELRLSAEAMGARMDVSRNWIQRLEGGDMELRVAQLAPIAEAYELPELELLRLLAPEMLEAHRRSLATDTRLEISPSAEFWQEVSALREEIAALARQVAGISAELQHTREAASSAARRAGRVEQRIAPLTEQLAMVARDFEKAREHGAAFLPSFMKEEEEGTDAERPRARLEAPELPES